MKNVIQVTNKITAHPMVLTHIQIRGGYRYFVGYLIAKKSDQRYIFLFFYFQIGEKTFRVTSFREVLARHFFYILS